MEFSKRMVAAALALMLLSGSAAVTQAEEESCAELELCEEGSGQSESNVHTAVAALSADVVCTGSVETGYTLNVSLHHASSAAVYWQRRAPGRTKESDWRDCGEGYTLKVNADGYTYRAVVVTSNDICMTDEHTVEKATTETVKPEAAEAPEQTESPAETPEVPAETPEAVETPEAPAETPEAPAETPEAPAETPEGVEQPEQAETSAPTEVPETTEAPLTAEPLSVSVSESKGVLTAKAESEDTCLFVWQVYDGGWRDCSANSDTYLVPADRLGCLYRVKAICGERTAISAAIRCSVAALDEEAQKQQDGLLARNPYLGWYGVKQTDERGMAIPMLFQTDYGDAICVIGGVPRSVASSGCGATSLSMVIAYLTGDTDQNPYTLFCETVDHGRYQGRGLSEDTLCWLAERHGVQGRWIRNSADDIVAALRAGYPIIAHMGPGIFTSRGHYVVLRGVTDDGMILINDPVSPIKCRRAFPVRTLIAQARNGSAFMVCGIEGDEWQSSKGKSEESAARAPKATAEAPQATPEPIKQLVK